MEIINAIAKTLKEEFDIKIYVDDIEIGFDTPCFYISQLEFVHTPYINNRYMLNIPFDIKYFCNDNSINKKIDLRNKSVIMLKLFKRLHNYNDLLGYDIHSEIIDNVLHFFVTYKIIVNELSIIDNEMESVEIKAGVKNG